MNGTIPKAGISETEFCIPNVQKRGVSMTKKSMDCIAF